MTQIHSRIARRSIVAASVLTLGVGAWCTIAVHAQDARMPDAMMGHEKMMPMTEEDHKMVMEQLNRMKQMAANPQEAETMKKNMARMMVMEHMSRMMAMDPQFQQAGMDAMNDPNVKKIHEEAMAMAKDPEQMKQIKQEIMGDEKEMKMVIHQAIMMTMMPDRMHEMDGKAMDKMGGMEKKMEEQK